VSEENVELARSLIDARRHGARKTMVTMLDRDVVVRSDPSWPEQEICGRDAVIGWWRSAWESLGGEARVEEMKDLRDHVLLRVCWTMRGTHSGVVGDLRWSEVVTFRDGRVIFVEYFLEHEAALKAVGLEE
jgi:ketosteroid isomerase-like protein